MDLKSTVKKIRNIKSVTDLYKLEGFEDLSKAVLDTQGGKSMLRNMSEAIARNYAAFNIVGGEDNEATIEDLFSTRTFTAPMIAVMYLGYVFREQQERERLSCDELEKLFNSEVEVPTDSTIFLDKPAEA